MPVEIELVHVDAGRCVVLARRIEAHGITAMALGEAVTAEAAEDRARSRLQAASAPAETPSQPEPPAQAAAKTRVKPAPVAAPAAAAVPLLPAPDPAPDPAPEPEPVAAAVAVVEPPADPEDWSSELAHLDLQLKRLGWSREQESVYLLRAFGHGSRSRLTTYGDLLAYLRALEGFAPGSDPASCPIALKRSDLLSQSDQLLSQLGWDAARGRQLLETQFQRSSRQQLSDQQLLEFNILLEEELTVVPQN